MSTLGFDLDLAIDRYQTAVEELRATEDKIENLRKAGDWKMHRYLCETWGNKMQKKNEAHAEIMKVINRMVDPRER